MNRPLIRSFTLCGFLVLGCGGGSETTPGAGTGGVPHPGTGGRGTSGGGQTGGSDTGGSTVGSGTGGVGSGGFATGGMITGGSNTGGSRSGGSGGLGGFGGFGLPGSGTGGVGSSTGGAGGGGAGVEMWHPFDVTFSGVPTTSQTTDSLSAIFTGPSGKALTIPGFYDGAGTWRIRFAPGEVGDWAYRTTSSLAALNGKTGTVHCVANTNPLVHGPLRIDAAHPHYFQYDDGTPYVLMAFEADWLGMLDFGNAAIPRAKALVDMYVARGFNHVLVNLFAYDTTWQAGKTSAEDFGPPADYPWKGSNGAPDQTQMNPTFFANYDRVVQYLFDHGVVAHIMLKVYNKGVNWPAKASPQDDLFFKFVVARYQAYPNLVWDFAKESNNEPDVAYKSGRITLIRAQDAYHHPVTTHTDLGYYGTAASRTLLDFRTDQNTQGTYYNTVISHRNSNPWPEFNSEFDYEIGNDGSKTYSHAADKLVVFKKACEIAMAGGHLGYYYTYHAWDVVRTAEVPGGLGYYKNLYGVLASTRWSELAPSDTLINNAADGRHCLAKEGTEYLVYLAGAGSASLAIKQVATGAMLKGKWVNLISGQEQIIAPVGNGQTALTNPWPDPALAHLAP